MNLILQIILASIGLWLFFIVVANFKEKFESKKLGKFNTIAGKILVVLFVICDGLFNITYGSILFLEPPNRKRLLLTARLKHIIGRRKSLTDIYWRYPLAMFFCKYLIEPWDIGHCGLGGK